MKIVFLSSADNYHTKKWCEYFVSRNHEVHVISFMNDKIDNVVVHYIDSGASTSSSNIKKIKYLFCIKKIKKIIKDINPDIINAHYITSYGMIATLLGLKKYILSVWGSDVYEFPKKSFIHKLYVKYILRKAPYIFSTSKTMAKEIQKYVNKDIYITPFGVKMDLFSPKRKKVQKEKYIKIGIAKSIKPIYGYDTLIKSLKIIKNKCGNDFLKLIIIGSGKYEKEYKDLAIKLDVAEMIEWKGFLSQEDVAKELGNIDIAVYPSLAESFGVSAIEAEATGLPVIITNVPGLLEVTIPNETSLVVMKDNSEELADKIIYLVNNEKVRKKMGNAARKFVESKYEYNRCFSEIEKLFIKISNSK